MIFKTCSGLLIRRRWVPFQNILGVATLLSGGHFGFFYLETSFLGQLRSVRRKLCPNCLPTSFLIQSSISAIYLTQFTLLQVSKPIYGDFILNCSLPFSETQISFLLEENWPRLKLLEKTCHRIWKQFVTNNVKNVLYFGNICRICYDFML